MSLNPGRFQRPLWAVWKKPEDLTQYGSDRVNGLLALARRTLSGQRLKLPT